MTKMEIALIVLLLLVIYKWEVTGFFKSIARFIKALFTTKPLSIVEQLNNYKARLEESRQRRTIDGLESELKQGQLYFNELLRFLGIEQVTSVVDGQLSISYKRTEPEGRL